MTSVIYGKCVTYDKCIMANVIMAKIFMAKILWQMKLSRLKKRTKPPTAVHSKRTKPPD